MKTTRKSVRGSAAIAVALAMVFTPQLLEAQTQVKSGYNMFSPEQDVEIGRQSSAQADSQLPLVRNSTVNNYVSSIGRKLAVHAPGPKFNYQFKVIDASDINAFALPGGFIYLNRGIIESAKNDGEVAGVLAHEIAHSALRHGTQNATKAQMTQAGVGILGAILGGKVSQGTGQIINVLGGFGLNALFMKYSREAESQADVIGTQILTRAGYNAGDQANFFRTLEKTDSRKKANFMQSHPAPPQRIQNIEKEARLLGVTPRAGQATAEFSRVQSALRSMPAAPTTQQIAQQQSRQPARTNDRNTQSQTIRVAAPSRQLRTYTDSSRLYAVNYPSNWKVYDGNGNAVTLAPEGGVGNVGGQTEIVYGAIVNHYEPFGNVRSRNGRYTMEQATDDLIQQIRKGSPHLSVVRGSQSEFRLAGGRGLGATLAGVSRNTGLRERVTIVTRQLADGHLIYMLFIVPEAEASNYSQLLTAMVNSLQVSDSGRH